MNFAVLLQTCHKNRRPLEFLAKKTTQNFAHAPLELCEMSVIISDKIQLKIQQIRARYFNKNLEN